MQKGAKCRGKHFLFFVQLAEISTLSFLFQKLGTFDCTFANMKYSVSTRAKTNFQILAKFNSEAYEEICVNCPKSNKLGGAIDLKMAVYILIWHAKKEN